MNNLSTNSKNPLTYTTSDQKISKSASLNDKNLSATVSYNGTPPSSKISISKTSSLSDEILYSLCKTYGERARLWRQKFAGLLPEVYKRRLFEKKGFSSIFEFATKLAGMSREQVNIVLRLEQKFEDKPILQKALTNGKISANKLIRIVSIATKENQEEIFEKAKILSNRALEVFVKDVKNWNEIDSKNKNPNGFQKPLFNRGMHVHGNKFLNESALKLDSDIENELIEMQEKGININEFLREALKKRKEDIKNEKLSIAKAQRLEQEERELIGIPPKKYMSIKIKKIIHKEHGTKCSIPGCTRPAKNLHHTGRFSLTKNHDPHFIAPLCEAHHEIAHKIDLKYTQFHTQKFDFTQKLYYNCNTL